MDGIWLEDGSFQVAPDRREKRVRAKERKGKAKHHRETAQRPRRHALVNLRQLKRLRRTKIAISLTSKVIGRTSRFAW